MLRNNYVYTNLIYSVRFVNSQHQGNAIIEIINISVMRLKIIT